MKYLNSAARERIYKLQALHTFCEGMRGTVDADTREQFDRIIEASENILSMWQDGISDEAKEGLQRYAFIRGKNQADSAFAERFPKGTCCNC